MTDLFTETNLIYLHILDFVVNEFDIQDNDEESVKAFAAFSSVSGANTNEESIHDNIPEHNIVELRCRKCPCECESKEDIDNHMITVHKKVVNQSEDYKFNCHLCDYKA